MNKIKVPIFWLLVGLILFPMLSQAQVTVHKNALFQHASPYLAMHGQDPVNWLNWQKNILQKAKEQNKIIMISSGYFSCHWCHVMQKKNYHDIKTANYLNKHFISVKIDRELTPDLDRYLINFAQRAAGHAGWPQHVFLTPNGYPFFAFTYKPNPDFLLSLQKIQSFWHTSQEKVIAAAKSSIQTPQKKQLTKISLAEFEQSFLQQLNPRMDMLSGGLKGSNKFPNAPILKTALLIKKPNEEVTDWLQITLDQIQSQHLFDHVYGGFYRYTVDPEWQTPHFEKMLYTQAQLANIFLIASKKYQRQDYLNTAKQTLEYVKQQLFHSPSGLYKSSQSAVDKNQIEAADYVWTKAELNKLLPKKHYQQISKKLTFPWHPKPTEKNWQAIKKLLAKNNIKPANKIPTDSKSILGWNGLLLSAFVNIGDIKTANSLAGVLIKNLDKKTPPRAISGKNTNMGSANIQDYAYIIQGLEELSKLNHNKKLIEKTKKYRRQANNKFKTKQGWLYSNSPLLPDQVGSWAMADSAIPSPTAILECSLNKQIKNNPLTYASYAQTSCK